MRGGGGVVGFKVHNMRDGGERVGSASDSEGSSLLACFTKQRGGLRLLCNHLGIDSTT